MKRGLFALALLACSSSMPVTLPQADAGNGQKLAIGADDPIVVVRGRSTVVHVAASILEFTGAAELTIALGPLPVGLSATSTTWHTADTEQPAITLTASADAPQTEQHIEVRAYQDGNVVAFGTSLLDVSSVEGALDLSFGDAGVALVDPNTDTHAEGIALAPDGSFVVAGIAKTPTTNPFVARVLMDGTPSSFVVSKAPFPIDGVSSAAVAPDGRVALGVTTGSNGAGGVIVLDATGNVAWALPTTNQPGCIAWDGDALFVCQMRDLLRIDASQQIATAHTDILMHALTLVAPGTVLVGGGGTAGAEIARYVVSNGAPVLDTAWDASGVVATKLSLTPSGSILAVGTGSVIQRFSADGTPDQFYAPLALPLGIEPIDLVPMPSGDALFVGHLMATGKQGTVLARYDASGALATDFGTYGHVFSLVGLINVPSGATLDSTGTRLCAAGTEFIASNIRAYVACYRLAP